MNMKEAIEFLEKKNISGDELFKMKIKNVKKLAKLLKRGEAFEKMWKEIKKGAVYKYLDKYEQKYFPKMKDESHFYECSLTDPHLARVYFKKEKNENKRSDRVIRQSCCLGRNK